MRTDAPPTTVQPDDPAAAAAAAVTADDGFIAPLTLPEVQERSIPIRTSDLTRLLLAEPGLAPEEREQLAQFTKLIGAVFHHEFQAWLMELKELYAPLDPDVECVFLNGHSRALTQGADEAFLGAFEATLIRANYRLLDQKVIEYAIRAPNEQGLTYIPNLGLFEHLRVYVRGDAQITRTRRDRRNPLRKEVLTFEGYQRVIVALKFLPGAELGPFARSDVLYLRLFKDVPHVDLEMHLPEQGTKVKMRMIDKAQIASPLVVGLPTLAFKLLFASLVSPWAIGGVLIAPFSAGLNSFFGFQRAKQRHLHNMIRHLYYLNLANNASVINYLIDSAQEEEYKEALLAYYSLWRHRDDPEPWDLERLDAHIEAFVKAKAGLEIDFEIGDALNKLTRLGLLHRDPQDHLHAAPIDRALAILDGQWDNYFHFT
jgi:Protein of unknown function (DUF3754)